MSKIKTVKTLEKPVWLKYSEKEVKKMVLDLFDKGNSIEKIGLILKDQYGIPKVKLFGLKIKKIIEEEKKEKCDEPTILNLKEKLDQIIKHYKKNKQDKNAERSLIITKAKLKKREDYHKKREKK